MFNDEQSLKKTGLSEVEAMEFIPMKFGGWKVETKNEEAVI